MHFGYLCNKMDKTVNKLNLIHHSFNLSHHGHDHHCRLVHRTISKAVAFFDASSEVDHSSFANKSFSCILVVLEVHLSITSILEKSVSSLLYSSLLYFLLSHPTTHFSVYLYFFVQVVIQLPIFGKLKHPSNIFLRHG